MRLPSTARPLRDQTSMSSRATPERAQMLALAGAALLALLLTACTETITKHGHQFQDNELQQVTRGMSQDQVRSTLGTPTTTATVGTGQAYYYISSTTGETSFFKPVEKDRKVVAVYFSPLGSVDRVANYGLKDGKVFDYAKQQTPSPARDEGILKKLFRSLGTKQLGGE
jgi:outer membrane protein assembly factor BamE (lipoprotein component of BamABCDE complex)